MDKKKFLNLYKKSYLIRCVENLISENYSKNKMRCPIHLSIGQEVCATGLISFLNKKDKLYSNHRCHAHYLAKGGNLDAMLSEIHGKKKRMRWWCGRFHAFTRFKCKLSCKHSNCI